MQNSQPLQIDDLSDELFGRYEALRIYLTIAGLSKDEFTTGAVARLAGASDSTVSRELRRLTLLGPIKRVSRRGEYSRVAASPFWRAVERVAELAESIPAEPDTT